MAKRTEAEKTRRWKKGVKKPSAASVKKKPRGRGWGASSTHRMKPVDEGRPVTARVEAARKKRLAKTQPVQPTDGKTLRVTFGAQGSTKKGFRLGVNVARTEILLSVLDQLITNGQLECRLIYDPNAGGDAPGQTLMEHGTSRVPNLDVVCRVAGFGVRGDAYSFSLGMSESVPVERLNEFCFNSGLLNIVRMGTVVPEDGE